MQDTAQEVVGKRRHAELVIAVEQAFLARLVPQRGMAVAAIAGEMQERLGHERCPQPVLLGDRLGHDLEEGVPVRGFQAVAEVPVHLELAVGVLMVVLIGIPAQTNHGVADFRNHVIAAHQGGLVVAGLFLDVARIGDVGAVFRNQVILALNAGLEHVAHFPGGLDLALQHDPRAGFDFLAVHPQV